MTYQGGPYVKRSSDWAKRTRRRQKKQDKKHQLRELQ